MNFTDLTLFKHKNLFINDHCKQQRNWAESYVLFCLLKQINPTRILEIGYRHGFTFSLMYETLKEHADYFTSCDITYAHDVASKLINFNRCEFMECKSRDLILNKTYNFVNIDGWHDYDPVFFELNICYQALEKNGVIMVDDYESTTPAGGPGITMALVDFLRHNSKIKPVLIGHQQIFLSETDLNENVLSNLIKQSKIFLSWDFTTWKNYNNVPRYRLKIESFLEKFPDLIKSLEQKSL